MELSVGFCVVTCQADFDKNFSSVCTNKGETLLSTVLDTTISAMIKFFNQENQKSS